MYSLIRPLLFKLPPEKAHAWVLSLLKWYPSFLLKEATGTPVRVMGIQFPHPIGLAAGFDKNGEYLEGLSKLGFSFIEVGTVTPRPQAGNPKPRLFRLEPAHALINRMGFNNKGVDVLVENLQKTTYQGILGINIGKNKETSLEEAKNDYYECLQKVYPFATYLTINVSSPNTPDLRQLQQRYYLSGLLDHLTAGQARLSDQYGRKVPLLIKISPDESDACIIDIARLAVEKGIAGIIATNTSCGREGVQGLLFGEEAGGLSGKPLFERSTACLKLIKQEVGDSLVLIGCGGIEDGDKAKKKFEAGASLLQLYTGLIYQGPALVRALVKQSIRQPSSRTQ